MDLSSARAGLYASRPYPVSDKESVLLRQQEFFKLQNSIESPMKSGIILMLTWRKMADSTTRTTSKTAYAAMVLMQRSHLLCAMKTGRAANKRHKFTKIKSNMQPPDSNSISQEEKIKILLQEYATLRQEIIARISHGYQIMSVGTVLFAWIFITKTQGIPFWLAFVIALIIFLFAVWFILRDINKAAERIRELETEINSRAGEELLVWESRWGSAVTGFWGRARPLDKTP